MSGVTASVEVYIEDFDDDEIIAAAERIFAEKRRGGGPSPRESYLQSIADLAQAIAAERRDEALVLLDRFVGASYLAREMVDLGRRRAA